MGTLLPEIAILGLVVAVTSPASVVTVIAVLSLAHGRVRAVAFIVGWILAIGVIAILMVDVLHGQDFHTHRTSPSRAASAAEILLGGLLVITSARAYRHPHREHKSQDPPKWLARLERSNPAWELIVGMFCLSYTLTLVAAAEILKAHVGERDAILVGLVFAVTSIVTIAAPLAIVLIAPDRSMTVLITWRDWMLAHSRSIALIALMVIGVALTARGVHDLVA